MTLQDILAIGGKPGLYKMVAQSRTGAIVQGLSDEKRFPVSSTSNVSSLQDIAIYTYDAEVPLKDIFKKIQEKESNTNTSVGHKESAQKLMSYFEEILPEFDQDRVYASDVKKVIQWYNTLNTAKLLDELLMDTEEAQAEEKSSEED